MTDTITVPEGAPAGLAYLINYSEDLWTTFDEESQEFCKAHWIKVATPIPEVTRVVLRLVPDPLFPMGAHEKPYVHWEHILEKDDAAAYTMAGTVVVKLARPWTPRIQSTVMRDIGMRYPAGTRFEIYASNGEVLSAGRV